MTINEFLKISKRKFKNRQLMSNLKTVSKVKLLASDFDQTNTFYESLILAQDERWRRA